MRLGGLAPLVTLALAGHDAQKEVAAAALGNLATDHDANKGAVVRAGGLVPLLEMMSRGTEAQKEAAACTLRSLAHARENKAAIASAGGVLALAKLARGGSAWRRACPRAR